MLIDRFSGTAAGTAYASAYQIIHAGEVDDWQISRPPVTTQIAGASGAFDFYGTANYPYGPMTVSKSFMATASTWAGVETALDALEDNTIYSGEGTLWAVGRDGTSHWWTIGKCTALDIGFKVDGNSPPFDGTAVFGQQVSIEFFCRTGTWRAEDDTGDEFFPGAPLAFDVKLLDGGGTVLTGGTITNVLSVSCEDRIDEAGAISFTVPATDSTVASLLSTAARFRVDFTGGTSVYGIIDKDITDATAQQPNRTVTGANMLRELQHYSMGWWCFYDDIDIVATVLPALLTDVGWTLSTTDASGSDIYYRFDGDSRLAALIKIAEASGKHFRLTNTFRQLEWGDFFAGSAVVTFYGQYNSGNYVTYDGIPIVGTLQITRDSGPIVNRIIPWGAGHDEGNLNRAKVSLFHLDRASPSWQNIKCKPGMRGQQIAIYAYAYRSESNTTRWSTYGTPSQFMTWPIQQLAWYEDPDDLTKPFGFNFVTASIEDHGSYFDILGRPSGGYTGGPASLPVYLAGNPQLYMEDAAAYAADPHEAVIIFDDVTLTDLSGAAFDLAAAQLYDRAKQYLETHKVAQIYYSLSVYNCPDSLRVGDIVHVTYAGEVTRNGVTVDWVDVDTDLNVINIVRRYNADGSHDATIEVSNVKVQPSSDSGRAISRTAGSVGYHAATVGALGGGASATTVGTPERSGEASPNYFYITLEDDASVELLKDTEGLGTLFAICVFDGSASMFSLTGANHVAYEMLDPQEQYTATAGTDGMTNIYCAAGTPNSYYIENKRGDARSYYIWMFGAKVK